MPREWVLLFRKNLNSMDPVVGASIVSAVGSGIANLAGSALERRSQKKQQELARQQSLQDRAHNEWYNSPAQQRERLRQAGIGISNDTVKADDTSSENMQYAEPLTNDILNSRSTGLQQLASAPAEAMKFALDIAEQTSKIKGLSSDNDLKDITLKYADENARLALDKGYNDLAKGLQELKNLRTYGNLNKANLKKVNQEIEFAERLQPAKEKLAEMQAAIAENRKKISDATVGVEIQKAFNDLDQQLASIRLTKAQISEVASKIANLDANTANLGVTYGILKETLSQSKAQTQFDWKTLDDRIDIVNSNAYEADNRANISESEEQIALNNEASWLSDKIFGYLSGLVAMGVSVFNAGTTRMMATKPVYGQSMLVDQNGRNFVTRNGQILQ